VRAVIDELTSVVRDNGLREPTLTILLVLIVELGVIPAPGTRFARPEPRIRDLAGRHAALVFVPLGGVYFHGGVTGLGKKLAEAVDRASDD
jgi:hypothetical protein